jgi:6-pyruvoyltetrahydropterin/6-carboxytetrahydropterin synthase
MTVIRITKEFGFEMAHALMGYNGPCKNIHGHSYKLFVTVIGSPITDKKLPRQGMVMDFRELKAIVKKNIIEKFDHALVLNNMMPEDVVEKISKSFEKLILVDYQPTSENFLIEFVEIIKPKLPPEIKLYSLKLSETATSYSEWYAGDNEWVANP